MAAGQRAIPVNWWSTENGINANQLLTLYAAEGGWQGEDENSQPSPPPCAATKACIWPSAASGRRAAAVRQLAAAGEQRRTGAARHAETLGDVDFRAVPKRPNRSPAHQIHTLRRSRGNGLKIAVREMSASLRYSDERLLLACGANLIVPHVAPLSRFLTMLEGIQGSASRAMSPPTSMRCWPACARCSSKAICGRNRSAGRCCR